ncbi:MAG TPA: divalent metal cation transporter [Aeromicrobium sp.]|nr:divalent metal cation transporter [Aeromicrobium sp.]HKY58733.1 divalent metal cation transporter [Aeromicrobium sp.]
MTEQPRHPDGTARPHRPGWPPLLKRWHSTRLSRFLRILGPGVITGAADDDPSGIATHSQAGAQFGLGMAWTMLLTLPLMTAVQEACARIGAVKGKGLAAVIRDRYSRRVLIPLVWLMVVANTINIGANIAAIAAATRLLLPWVPIAALSIAFVAAILVFEVYTSYRIYARVLKWLVLALLAYPVTAFVVGQPWGELLRATVVPRAEFTYEYLFILTGIFGTTISPYLFFWQASEVVEEELERHEGPAGGDHRPVSARFLRQIRVDNAIGMCFANLAAWFIIVTCASVLFEHGVRNIATAEDAARALEPLVNTFPHAGFLAKAIFAVGIIGLGLLAIPTLAGSAAYGLAETYGWREGLSLRFRHAHGFYGVMVIATLVGLALPLTGVDPMRALVVAGVVNGVVAVPLLLCLALLARDPVVMGPHRSGRLSSALVWTTFAVMAASGAMLLASVVLT